MEKKLHLPYSGIEKLTLKIPGNYTVVYCPYGKTLLMEISIFNRHGVWPYFKITQQKEDDHPVPIPFKEHSQPLSMADVSKNWMLFEGHDLPIIVDSRYPQNCNRGKYRFRHNDPPTLRAFLEAKCINLSVGHLTKVDCYTDAADTTEATVVFPAERNLWNIDFYFEHELFPGVYFAIAGDFMGSSMTADIAGDALGLASRKSTIFGCKSIMRSCVPIGCLPGITTPLRRRQATP